MKTMLYFDCFSGISGDMVLGAFLDAGVELRFLQQELAKLKLHGFQVTSETKMSYGISGTKCHVLLEEHHGDAHEKGHDHHHHHRHYEDIQEIIQKSTLEQTVKNTALAIFDRVARAESKVHQVPVEKVHFHEVGALDSIVDIVGAAICYHALNPDYAFGSSVNVGSGWVKCEHGLLPVPAPATAEILCESTFEMFSNRIDGEAATPTGVAILAELAKHVPKKPSFRPIGVGYGFGQKDFGMLNALRLFRGEISQVQLLSLMAEEKKINAV